ncbi:MAG TPA: hypothetical protein VHQ65_16110 [Thermoanaerobaculia bacterium]|nr:hypothetical protein [Thermoanaerobaculia bacterium]
MIPPSLGRRVAAGAGALAMSLLAGAAVAAAAPGGLLEVPEVVRLGGGSLGPVRVFESAPIRIRLGRLRAPRVVRLVLELPDPRWRGAEVSFTTTARHGCAGLGGDLLPGVPSPVLRTAPGAAAAEADVVLRITAPARGLGAGPRALRLRWDAVEDPREPFAAPGAPPPGVPPLERDDPPRVPGRRWAPRPPGVTPPAARPSDPPASPRAPAGSSP